MANPKTPKDVIAMAKEAGALIVDLRFTGCTKTREQLRRGGRLLPRCSCPYAGTTRIRFEGLPSPAPTLPRMRGGWGGDGRRSLSPLSGHPLDSPIIGRAPP